MMKRRVLKLGMGLAVAWWGSGCSVLKPVPDPTRFYLLDAPSVEALPMSGGLAIGLEPIQVPDYLKARTIAVRDGRTEVVYADIHRWAEEFEAALLRGVAGHLRAAPSIRSVSTPPWTGRPVFDRILQLQIHACEGASDGTVLLAASWRIRTAESREERAAGQAELIGSWPPGDYRTLVQQLSRLIEQLCAHIVADLEESDGAAP